MRFEPNMHTALWGTENWVCSAHHTSPSVIKGGRHAGKALDQVYPDFPLLMKVIDAESRLSVQVHPNETTCKVTGGDPKTEMWCALSDGPNLRKEAPERTGASERRNGKIHRRRAEDRDVAHPRARADIRRLSPWRDGPGR